MTQKATHLFKHLKFWVSTFIDKDLTLFAASLSFYTIFTIIPLLLIMMTLLTSLPDFVDYYEKIEAFIFSNLMPINSEIVMRQINAFIENASELGFIGVVAILVSSALFFENFEYIANKIFHVKDRTLVRSFGVYIVFALFTPIALGISFYITGHVAALLASHSLTSGLDILPFVPYVIIWALFFLIFHVAPNVDVNPKASAISSFIIAIVFTLSKQLFIFYVFFNRSYATMYGSFATLIFLFLWIYVSWIIFIYGLKLCHIIDNLYKKKSIMKV
jgi:membrane protein